MSSPDLSPLSPLLPIPLPLFSLLSFLTPLVLGLRIFTTSHRLNLLRLQQGADAFKPHIYTPFRLLQHPDSDSASDPESGGSITRQDLEATHVMRSTRRIALFGPLLCLPGFVAMPLLLYLSLVENNNNNNANDPSSEMTSRMSIGVAASVLFVLLAIIHCSNASAVQHYFSLVEDERNLQFGKEIRTARQERLQSRGFARIYLTALLILCGIGASPGGCRVSGDCGRVNEE